MNGPRLLIDVVAIRRKDLVQRIIDALPAVGDLAERQDLDWWASGSAYHGATIIIRRLRHDMELLEQIEDSLLEELIRASTQPQEG